MTSTLPKDREAERVEEGLEEACGNLISLSELYQSQDPLGRQGADLKYTESDKTRPVPRFVNSNRN